MTTNAETIYFSAHPDLQHYGVLGMKWGVHRYRKEIAKAQKNAMVADKRQALSNKVEGTNGSQLRRLASRPLQASANRRGNSADKTSQLAYLKASRKINKWERKTDPSNKESLDKLDKLHEGLQNDLQGVQAIRSSTYARNNEHRTRQINEIYGHRSNGAKISVALSAMDADTGRKINTVSDAIDIASLAAPGPKSRAIIKVLNNHPKEALTFARNMNAGKVPGQDAPTKADQIERAQALTGTNGKTGFIGKSSKIYYKKKLSDALS